MRRQGDIEKPEEKRQRTKKRRNELMTEETALDEGLRGK